MKTDQPKKVIIKVDSGVDQENVKTTRRGLKSIQPTAVDKQNLTGRSHILKDSKHSVEGKKDKPSYMHKGTQTEKYVQSVDDLIGDEASLEYWKRLAEKKQESIDDSFQEIEKLKSNIEILQEENKICKEMLEESKHLVEVLKEIINEEDDNDLNDDEEKKDSDGTTQS